LLAQTKFRALRERIAPRLSDAPVFVFWSGEVWLIERILDFWMT
jgi:hypothetical protein